jgi:Zn-dependent protease with chaperone function
MKLPPSPSNRRRRLKVAAGVLLLVASLTAWWNWPRGAARFVGTWSAADEVQPDRPILTYIFKSNGRGVEEDGSTKTVFSWTVSGDTLTLGPNSPSSLRPVLERLARQISAWTHCYVLWDPHDFEIQEISETRMVILSKDVWNARRKILTRRPE